ncbi:uncharacterized protein LOC132636745 isoform X2 [Lycium barbarum]|uniref:uncharacterized protein LOC132636745 isoform X2 n=1 Tax=Lycium barbarum TaxID=112863 RepID=UPI00293EB58B|nr:uncharacterized protein LOC132636745 isoform X2 [Lycium barbarum]
MAKGQRKGRGRPRKDQPEVGSSGPTEVENQSQLKTSETPPPPLLQTQSAVLRALSGTKAGLSEVAKSSSAAGVARTLQLATTPPSNPIVTMTTATSVSVQGTSQRQENSTVPEPSAADKAKGATKHAWLRLIYDRYVKLYLSFS